MSEPLKTENTNVACDVCGLAATYAARDLMRHEPPWESYVSFRPFGPIKYGCAAHPVQSKQYLSSKPAPEGH